YADRRDRGIDGGSLGLRRRQDVDERGQPRAEAPIAGEQPNMHDVDGSKTVVCATSPEGQTLIVSCWRPAFGRPQALAAPAATRPTGGRRAGRPRRTGAAARGNAPGMRLVLSSVIGYSSSIGLVPI